VILLASLLLTVAPAAETSGDAARDLVSRAHRTHVHGDPAEALELALAAVDMARSADPATLAHALNWAGWICGDLGRPDLALVLLRQAEQVARDLSHPAALGLATQEIGNNLRRLGRLDEAEAAVQTSVGVARDLGIGAGITEGNAILAELALSRGDLDGAEALLLEADSVAGSMGYAQAQCVAQEVLGRVYWRGGERAAAIRSFENAVDLARAHTLPRCEAAGQVGLARAESDPERAWLHASEALRLYEDMTAEGEATAHTVAGATLIDLDELERASQSLDVALDLVRMEQAVGDVLSERARIDSLRGEHRAALEDALDALDAYEAAGDAQKSAALHAAVGDAWLDADDLAFAAEHYRAALAALDGLPVVATFPHAEAARRDATLLLLEKLRELDGRSGR